jgi:hypothetical protein
MAAGFLRQARQVFDVGPKTFKIRGVGKMNTEREP